MTISNHELMTLRPQLLFTHDERLRLLAVNEPDGGGPAPRLYIGRTPAGNIWRFRADLPENLVEELNALCRAEPTSIELRDPPRHLDAYKRLLEAHAPVGQIWMGPAYYFAQRPTPTRTIQIITEANADSLRQGFGELIEELPSWQPFVGLMEQDRVVSVCRSVRITAAAHEAGVETLPEFRGRGYAVDVVAGWARHVQQMGAIATYSTAWENHASQAVARKLGLLQFGADFHMA